MYGGGSWLEWLDRDRGSGVGRTGRTAGVWLRGSEGIRIWLDCDGVRKPGRVVRSAGRVVRLAEGPWSWHRHDSGRGPGRVVRSAGGVVRLAEGYNCDSVGGPGGVVRSAGRVVRLAEEPWRLVRSAGRVVRLAERPWRWLGFDCDSVRGSERLVGRPERLRGPERVCWEPVVGGSEEYSELFFFAVISLLYSSSSSSAYCSLEGSHLKSHKNIATRTKVGTRVIQKPIKQTRGRDQVDARWYEGKVS